MKKEEFIKKTGLTMNAVHAGFNSHTMQDDFRIILLRGSQHFTTEYHMGYGHRVWTHKIESPLNDLSKPGRKAGGKVQISGKLLPHGVNMMLKASKITTPTLVEVVHCLFLDASCVESATFEDFCSDMGYDTDSRKAEGIYRACQNTRAALVRLFGETFYRTGLDVNFDE
jgi:hypothetical protein